MHNGLDIEVYTTCIQLIYTITRTTTSTDGVSAELRCVALREDTATRVRRLNKRATATCFKSDSVLRQTLSMGTRRSYLLGLRSTSRYIGLKIPSAPAAASASAPLHRVR